VLSIEGTSFSHFWSTNMTHPIEIHGTLRPNGVLVLDHMPNVQPGRFRVTLEPIANETPEPQPQPSPEIPQWALDLARFQANRLAYPEEKLEPFWGMQVAWNKEGTQIVASAGRDEDPHAKLKELGLDPCEVVIDFIHDPFVSYI
jgi:hypothetical protein